MTTDTQAFNPFPGLRPFREDEDYLFFGREDQTIELLSRLGSQRFVAVVGTSASGKSSLVRCGLLSQLQGGKMLQAGTRWEIAISSSAAVSACAGDAQGGTIASAGTRDAWGLSEGKSASSVLARRSVTSTK